MCLIKHCLSVLVPILIENLFNRGRTIWELYTVQAFIIGQKWQTQTISKEEFKKSLQELVPMIDEVKKCLEYSPEKCLEHQIFKLCCKALVNTKDTILFLDHM